VINVGSTANTLDPIQDVVRVNGRGGNTTLNINDQGTAAREEYDVYADRIDREPFTPGQPAPPPTQTISYSGIASLTVRGGSATSGDAFFVLSTPAGTAASLYAGGGRSNEFIIESTGGNLDGIQGPVAVHGVSAFDFSVVYDYGNASGHTYTLSTPDLTTSLLQRDGLAAITQDGIGEMILYVPVVGGNHINVQGVPTSLFANLTTSNGDQDTVGRPAPNNGLTMEGIQGTVSFSFEAPTVTAPVTLALDDSGDESTSPSTAPRRVSVGLDYPDPNGFAWINNLAGKGEWVGWRYLPTGSTVTVSGRVHGNETFAVQAFQSSIAPTIRAGGSNNTLDYSAYTGDVTVNLGRGTATGLAGTSGIQNVNILIGGTGRNILIGGDGLDQLTGGGGDNLLIGGGTIYDQNAAALDLLMQEWMQSSDFATRQNAIEMGLDLLAGTGIKLDDTTLLPDGLANILIAGPGNNWVIP
jgi:hypothetical protein